MQGLPQADLIACRIGNEFVHGGFANAPGGIVDDALETFVVVGVDGQTEVGQKVFDLLALVKGQPSIDAVGNVEFSQALLKGTRLGIGPIEDGKVLVKALVVATHFKNAVGHKASFVVVRRCTEHLDFFSLGIGRPNLFGDLVFVVGDDRVGRFDDVRAGAVVLLEFEQLRFRVVLLEVQDVLDVGASERIDALGIVAHDAYIFMHCAELLDDQVLGEVGVLVLVHEDVLEPVLVFVQEVGKVPKQHIHLVQQVVEVHGTGPETPHLILGIDVGEHGTSRLLVLRTNLGMLRVRARIDEVVLGCADAGLHTRGFVHLVVQPHPLDDVLQQAAAVLGVIDGEVARIVDALAFDAQDAGKDTVKGAHPQVPRLAFAHQLADAILHFSGRLVREGQGQNGERIHPLHHHVGDAVRQHPCFPRASSCNDHHRTIDVGSSFSLRIVQIVEKIHFPKVEFLCASPMNFGHTRAQPLRIKGLENSREKSVQTPCFLTGFIYFCTPFRIWGEYYLCP